MEQSFEIGLSLFVDVFDSVGEVIDCVGEIHESGVNQAAIEIVETVVGSKVDGFFELGQGVVDLVQHHHAVASVGVVLGLLVVKSDSCTEVIHGFLIVADSHEGISSVRVILCMGSSFVTGWSTLEAGNSLTEFLNGHFRILSLFMQIVLG